MERLTIADLASLCKKTGFIFQSAESYGGLSGFWDYGPRGVELKNNIKNLWWKTFVQDREDVVGLDGSIITHPKVWVASGHVENFTDFIAGCPKCNAQFRADHLYAEMSGKSSEGVSKVELAKLLEGKKCPSCKKGEFSGMKKFNLMFHTTIGPVEDEKNRAYLRPETAQSIFANFRTIVDTSRVVLPFGIAQIGKAFRNEISPRDFLFRSREFEQMEMEFFVHPDEVSKCPLLTKQIESFKISILTAEDQEKEKNEAKEISIGDALKKKIFSNPWLAYWAYVQYKWFVDFGIKQKNLRLRQHVNDELAHYAKGCIDIEYNFPIGWKEIHGMADRGQFDLSQHQKVSGKSMEMFDEESKKRVVPHVAAEPSQGVDRAFMAFLIDAYERPEPDHAILKIHPKLAPMHVGVFPLMKKDGLAEKAREVFEILRGKFKIFYDESGSIGKRYYRSDEIGVPYALTIDHDTLKDDTVTIRWRDDGEQRRIKIKDLEIELRKLLG